MLSCGSQNVIIISNKARSVLIVMANARFITLFRVLSKLINWKLIVLFILKE